MPIFVEHSSRVICQGLLSEEEIFHIHQCKLYGTKVVAWVKAGFGGQERVGLPVFDSMREARRQTNATVSLMFVEPHAVADAAIEAVESGIETMICLTEGIPLHEMVKIHYILSKYPKSRMIGPGACGLITPSQSKVGVMPAYIFSPGPVGMIASVDTLGYEAAWQMTNVGVGQTTFVGVGDEPIRGTSIVDVLSAFDRDEHTEVVVMVLHHWEKEREAIAKWVEHGARKPLLAVIAGHMVPWMGHHPTVVAEGSANKDISDVLRGVGVRVIEDVGTIGSSVEQVVIQRRLKEFS